jgi:prolipoprotein diacylglyceryltransferase
MSWFGGFAGGVLAGLMVVHRKRLPKVRVLAVATPALAVGARDRTNRLLSGRR